ncbi:MAG: ATP phosphoribosyltransferase [Campylobacterales bacterium]|nr:ATP phosphoribosyltransferase [Campylobacterales bacterium]
MLTIALPKGRIGEDTLELFRKIFDGDFAFDSRKLILEQGNFKFLLVRGQDVPTYVENGAADLGIVGQDVLSEQGTEVTKLLDLGFGRCNVVVGMKKGEKLDYSKPETVIATKMVNIAQQYFDSKAMSVKIVKLYGSIELAPLVDLCDAIVDIVETGTTMRENGLEPVETIMETTAKLFANRDSFIQKKEEILDLKNKIAEVL